MGWVLGARDIAAALDQAEMRLERIRVALGFKTDWSPAYDRKQRGGVSQPTSWGDKAASMNGMGDLQRFIGELAGGVDVLEGKIAEALVQLGPREVTAKAKK